MDELTQIGITQKNELIRMGRTQMDEQTAFRCFRCEILAYRERTIKNWVKFSESSTAGEAEETGVCINTYTTINKNENKSNDQEIFMITIQFAT